MNILDDALKIELNMKLKSSGLNKLIRYLVKFKRFPNKQPQRKYRQKIRDCLRIVLINLVDAVEYIRYSRDDHYYGYKSNKYSVRNIRRVVDFLVGARLVKNKVGFNNRTNPELNRQSRMNPTNKLKSLFETYGVNQSEIVIDKKKDEIILRPKKKKIYLRAKRKKYTRNLKPISYKDTPFTLSAKENLKNINGLLSDHHIIDGKGRYIHRKIMHRVFNVDFEHGGRFYGGEWQNMSGNDRLKLTINNHPVVEYDYDAIHPTILYAKVGMRLEEDPYLLNGYSPELRDFLKIVMLVLINTGNTSNAKKAIQDMIEFEELILPGEAKSLDYILNKFMDKHASIAHLFRDDIGLRLQWYDSDICESVLMHFYQNDIPVLPVHDSFIIQKDYENMLPGVMKEAFYNKCNADCLVSKKAEKHPVPEQSEKNSNLYETLSSRDLQQFLPEIFC